MLQTKHGAIELVDAQDLLRDCIIFFAFPNSRSANLPIAIRLAKAATAYGEQDIDGRCLHWAAFKNTADELERAAELLRLAGSWVGAITRIRGQRVANPYMAFLTISCYLDALQCTSQSAHCHKLIDDPFHPDFNEFEYRIKPASPSFLQSSDAIETTEDVLQYIFPCKRMLEASSVHPQFEFTHAHRSTMPAVIQAAAVQYGISICPYFDASAFREAGTRVIKVYAPIRAKSARRGRKPSTETKALESAMRNKRAR